ncbi:MAG: AccI family restriction endonuclease [Acidobacteria bacterium]|nr:AccI family restriction endonuclease [Acidobacteriota bacterium]
MRWGLKNKSHWCSFESALSLAAEDIEIELRGQEKLAWSDFLLNPRRLRGSDFLMRWSQGVWSEERLVQAINETGQYFALPYGPSGTAPDDDVRAFELYFERLEKAGLGKLKRPDLLIFKASNAQMIQETVANLGGVGELPFTSEEDERIRAILAKAIIAVECENSLWRAKQMPDYGATLTAQRRLDGKLGLKKAAVLPTVILKEEDRKPLFGWQSQNAVKIHIWHVFFDMAFGLSLDTAQGLITNGNIQPTEQIFQAPGGATTKKAIYKFYYHYAYPLGETLEEPQLIAECITDKNGHILPYVKFAGGRLAMKSEALEILSELSESLNR